MFKVILVVVIFCVLCIYYYCYCGLYQWHNAVGACVCYFLLCDDR